MHQEAHKIDLASMTDELMLNADQTAERDGLAGVQMETTRLHNASAAKDLAAAGATRVDAELSVAESIALERLLAEQDDTPVPEHLRLGHASDTSWAALRVAAGAKDTLRATRVYGPEYLAAKAGHPSVGYCDTCVSCGSTEAVAEVARTLVSSSTFDVIESLVVASSRSEPIRSTMPGYEHLVRGDGASADRPAAGDAPIGTRVDALVGMFG